MYTCIHTQSFPKTGGRVFSILFYVSEHNEQCGNKCFELKVVTKTQDPKH